MLEVLRFKPSYHRLELTVIICWQIWKHRNDEIFNGNLYDPKKVVTKSSKQWSEWLEYNSKYNNRHVVRPASIK